jgi:uncharacterized protein
MERIAVEVVYALPGAADVVRLTIPAATTAAEAVRVSGILERHPELLRAQLTLGIYGKPVAGATKLYEGDRVEIYRPLMLDPKEARRRRARKGS